MYTGRLMTSEEIDAQTEGGSEDVGALCFYCKRLTKATANKMTCEAFPKGIPGDIIVWKADHRDPFRGDNGLTFVVHPKLEKDYTGWIEGVDQLFGTAEKKKKKQRSTSLAAIAKSIAEKEAALKAKA